MKHKFTLLGTLLVISFCLPIGYLLSTSYLGTGVDKTSWAAHVNEVQSTPEALHFRDRFRKISGTVYDVDGQTVAGCRVSLVDTGKLARAIMPGSPLRNAALLGADAEEASVVSGADGSYVFSAPSAGLKSLEFTKAGWVRDRIDYVIVRDGYGNWGRNASLKKASAWTFAVRDTSGQPRGGVRVSLLGHAWWQAVPTAVTDPIGRCTLEGFSDRLSDLDVWMQDEEGGIRRTSVVEGSKPTSVIELVWGDKPPAMDCDALFISTERLARPSDCLTQELSALNTPDEVVVAPETPLGLIHGFVERSFLPLRVESVDGEIDLEIFANEAAEFRAPPLPVGFYQLRSIGELGAPLFSRFAYAQQGGKVPYTNFTTIDHIDLSHPKSRIVHGTVSLAGSGIPLSEAEVWCQDVTSFRRYLRVEKTDTHGYFRFTNVEPGSTYVLFALAKGDKDCQRHLRRVTLARDEGEAAKFIELHPLVIEGRIASNKSIRVEKKDGDTWGLLARLVTSSEGQFRLSYLEPGIYRVVEATQESDQLAPVLWGPSEPSPLPASQ